MNTITAFATSQTTESLVAALTEIDNMPRAAKTPEHRATYTAICEVIETRHNLDAAIESVYDNAGDERITYCQAITKALAA